MCCTRTCVYAKALTRLFIAEFTKSDPNLCPSSGLATRWRVSAQRPQRHLHVRLLPPLVLHQQRDRSGEKCIHPQNIIEENSIAIKISKDHREITSQNSIAIKISSRKTLLRSKFKRWGMEQFTPVTMPATMSSKDGWHPLILCFNRIIFKIAPSYPQTSPCQASSSPPPSSSS